VSLLLQYGLHLQADVTQLVAGKIYPSMFSPSFSIPTTSILTNPSVSVQSYNFSIPKQRTRRSHTFYGPFSGTTRISRCQKQSSRLWWCKGRSEADTKTIRVGDTPYGLISDPMVFHKLCTLYYSRFCYFHNDQIQYLTADCSWMVLLGHIAVVHT